MRRSFPPVHYRTIIVPGLSLILLLAVFLPGCVVGDFISVYFNNYYNAQRAFDKAEEEVWALPETRMSGRNLLVPFTISSQTKTEFTQVIEKCSKLLQYHPDSRYVDDALFMIAKCYYYQGEYQSAERKCLEIAKEYPESDLILDAEMMLACSRYKAGDLTGSEVAAKDAIDEGTKQGNDRIVARASLVEAAILADRREFDGARTAYQRAADLGDNREIKVGAILKVAEMSRQLSQFKSAEDAYLLASQESRTYTGEYEGMMGVARMRARQGSFDGALSTLTNLRNNANNKEFFGEISLEMAEVYRDMGDLDGAVLQYRKVDTTFARTDVSARSYYHLGLLYENRLFLYDSARITYNKGRSEFPQATVTAQLSRRGDYLNRYFQFKGELARIDSLREALKKRADSLAILAVDTLAAKPTAQVDTATHPVQAQLVSPSLNPDSLDAREGRVEDEIATLFYATMDRPDSALVWYQKALQDHPDAPYVPRILYTMAQIYARDTTIAPATIDSLYHGIVNRFPESNFAVEARKLIGLPPVQPQADPALTLYTRSEELINAGLGAAAIDTLKDLVSRYPRSPYAVQAEYAVGWIYENMTQQPESSYVHYDRVLRIYPGSVYAMRIAGKVGDPDVRSKMLNAAKKVDTAAVKPPVMQKDTTGIPPKPFNDETEIERRREVKPDKNKPADNESDKPSPEKKPEN